MKGEERSHLLTNITRHELEEHALGGGSLGHGHFALQEALPLEEVLEHRHRSHMESEVEVSEGGSNLLRIVLPPALLVRQHLECLCDLLEFGLGLGVSILIRVVSEGERAIRLLDLLWLGSLGEAEYLVVVFLAAATLRRYHSFSSSVSSFRPRITPLLP
ncbi:hypothetical protein PENTCL1PPCAC_5787 [Pristionchus entomophagus]|uniref:G protein-coupled receptor n=1 Tax=Pristionchus entomophagus TaxID=358040 RepID=A0AAV5SM38_9BILA|nr:hypothetical protein PENTCL1PPCAC_5787 [Pristionchus entomophagus]